MLHVVNSVSPTIICNWILCGTFSSKALEARNELTHKQRRPILAWLTKSTEVAGAQFAENCEGELILSLTETDRMRRGKCCHELLKWPEK